MESGDDSSDIPDYSSDSGVLQPTQDDTAARSSSHGRGRARYTEEERKDRRRAANRESARRMRAKRNEAMSVLQHSVARLADHNKQLQQENRAILKRLQRMEVENKALRQQSQAGAVTGRLSGQHGSNGAGTGGAAISTPGDSEGSHQAAHPAKKRRLLAAGRQSGTTSITGARSSSHSAKPVAASPKSQGIGKRRPPPAPAPPLPGGLAPVAVVRLPTTQPEREASPLPVTPSSLSSLLLRLPSDLQQQRQQQQQQQQAASTHDCKPHQWTPAAASLAALDASGAKSVAHPSKHASAPLPPLAAAAGHGSNHWASAASTHAKGGMLQTQPEAAQSGCSPAAAVVACGCSSCPDAMGAVASAPVCSQPSGMAPATRSSGAGPAAPRGSSSRWCSASEAAAGAAWARRRSWSPSELLLGQLDELEAELQSPEALPLAQGRSRGQVPAAAPRSSPSLVGLAGSGDLADWDNPSDVMELLLPSPVRRSQMGDEQQQAGMFSMLPPSGVAVPSGMQQVKLPVQMSAEQGQLPLSGVGMLGLPGVPSTQQDLPPPPAGAAAAAAPARDAATAALSPMDMGGNLRQQQQQQQYGLHVGGLPVQQLVGGVSGPQRMPDLRNQQGGVAAAGGQAAAAAKKDATAAGGGGVEPAVNAAHLFSRPPLPRLPGLMLGGGGAAWASPCPTGTPATSAPHLPAACSLASRSMGSAGAASGAEQLTAAGTAAAAAAAAAAVPAVRVGSCPVGSSDDAAAGQPAGAAVLQEAPAAAPPGGSAAPEDGGLKAACSAYAALHAAWAAGNNPALEAAGAQAVPPAAAASAPGLAAGCHDRGGYGSVLQGCAGGQQHSGAGVSASAGSMGAPVAPVPAMDPLDRWAAMHAVPEKADLLDRLSTLLDVKPLQSGSGASLGVLEGGGSTSCPPNKHRYPPRRPSRLTGGTSSSYRMMRFEQGCVGSEGSGVLQQQHALHSEQHQELQYRQRRHRYSYQQQQATGLQLASSSRPAGRQGSAQTALTASHVGSSGTRSLLSRPLSDGAAHSQLMMMSSGAVSCNVGGGEVNRAAQAARQSSHSPELQGGVSKPQAPAGMAAGGALPPPAPAIAPSAFVPVVPTGPGLLPAADHNFFVPAAGATAAQAGFGGPGAAAAPVHLAAQAVLPSGALHPAAPAASELPRYGAATSAANDGCRSYASDPGPQLQASSVHGGTGGVCDWGWQNVVQGLPGQPASSELQGELADLALQQLLWQQPGVVHLGLQQDSHDLVRYQQQQQQQLGLPPFWDFGDDEQQHTGSFAAVVGRNPPGGSGGVGGLNLVPYGFASGYQPLPSPPVLEDHQQGMGGYASLMSPRGPLGDILAAHAQPAASAPPGHGSCAVAFAAEPAAAGGGTAGRISFGRGGCFQPFKGGGAAATAGASIPGGCPMVPADDRPVADAP